MAKLTAEEIMEGIVEICDEHECVECPFGCQSLDGCPFEYGFNYSPSHWKVTTAMIKVVKIV